jgi:hypothetical protein
MKLLGAFFEELDLGEAVGRLGQSSSHLPKSEVELS